MTCSNNPLMPGHTKQVFSLLRGGLYAGVVPIKERNPALGRIVQVFTYFASKGSEYIEVPIRTIEDVALTAINLLGALFLKTCQNNLAVCTIDLFTDLYDIGTISLVLYFPLIKTLTIAYHILCALAESNYNPEIVSQSKLQNHDLTCAQREGRSFSF